ncbi:MAG: hypothetical protein E6K53_05885 [Gammaproteobacteria bacterium]|nr:MAG: hypothetical protein E6K53_05885 [Gammaproteobacteria bacterium]
MKTSFDDRARQSLTALALVVGIAFSASEAKAAQVLYVGNDNTPGTVLQYSLPLTASSTSNFGIASNNVLAVAVDASGNLAVGSLGGGLQFFTAPLSAASVPSATFPNGAASNNGGIAFTNAGDFWAATFSNQVNAFTHPFSNASTPSTFVTNAAMASTAGTAFTCSSGAGLCSNLLVYAPPYSGAPIITPNVPSAFYRKIAVTTTQLFAASVAGATGRVDAYNLPITAASVPAFSFVAGVNLPEALAVDASGNLYVGNLGNATVSVYNAPITSASVPSVVLTIGSGAFAIFGIAIGNAVVAAPPVAVAAPAFGMWGMLFLSAMLTIVVAVRLRRRKSAF